MEMQFLSRDFQNMYPYTDMNGIKIHVLAYTALCRPINMGETQGTLDSQGSQSPGTYP